MSLTKEDLDKCAEKDFEQVSILFVEEPFLKFKEVVQIQLKNFYYAMNNYFFVAYGGLINNTTLITAGALFRNQELYKSCLYSLKEKNIHMNAYSIRGILETLALIYYSNLNKDYIETALLGSRESEDDERKIDNILKMIDKLDKKHPGVRQDYDSLSEFIHPNPNSLFSSFSPKEDKEGHFTIRFGGASDKFDMDRVITTLKLLTVWTKWFFEEIETLFKKDKEDKNESR